MSLLPRKPPLGAGAQIIPSGAITTGDTVLVVLGIGPLQLIAPCRIVYVIDEESRFGFAYGTLPGHPERGEESFFVERDHGVPTAFRIRAFSRPAQLMTRLGTPVARVFQVRITLRYLDSLANFVRSDDHQK